MRIELKTDVILHDGGDQLILLSTKAYVNHTHGSRIVVDGNDYVVVGHKNYSTFASYAFNRTIDVVPPQFWIPVENPEPGDNAVIGYYRWGRDIYKHHIGIYLGVTLRNPLRNEDARLDGTENVDSSFKAILPGCAGCHHLRIEPDGNMNQMLARCAVCHGHNSDGAPFIARHKEYNTIMMACYNTPTWCPTGNCPNPDVQRIRGDGNG